MSTKHNFRVVPIRVDWMRPTGKFTAYYDEELCQYTVTDVETTPSTVFHLTAVGDNNTHREIELIGWPLFMLN